MFRSKQAVDRHVQEILRKVTSEKDRNMRCYNIALQYYKVRDYESAKHYLSLYLSVKEDSPLAHKLQGQIYEGLGDKVRALNSYKTSLEYEANQPELVLKMCQLLCETDVAMDTDRAHYWCDRASEHFPHDPCVFRLREKLLKLTGRYNSVDFEDLINSEMKARPGDVVVRIRLMQLYLDTRRTKAAFNHAIEVEDSQMFQKELSWYECFSQICEAYASEFSSQADWQFYSTWVSVLDRLTSLTLSELSAPKKLQDWMNAVFNMDQVLFKAGNVAAPKDHSEVYKQFIKHMSAQLCLHIATLILKKAKRDPNTWRETTRTVSPVLFLASAPPLDTIGLQIKSNLKQNITRWTDDAYYRVSQAGYTILAIAKDAGNQFTEKVTLMATGNWREKTFQKIFTGPGYRSGMSTSHFLQSDLIAKVSAILPVYDSGFLRTRQLVPVYEKVRDTLHHLVWLGLEVARHNNNKLHPDFHTYNFSRLKFTTHNQNNMSVETLCILDIDAFLYATIFCTKSKLEEEFENGLYSKDRPVTLPADISSLLCSQEQMSWWQAACQVNNRQSSDEGNVVARRQQLQRGLEVVRADGNHGLHVVLLVHLARTFADRAANASGQKAEQIALENRAALYWSVALPMLERMERNQAVNNHTSKLFEYSRKEPSSVEILSMLEEGRYFTACLLMKSEQYEKAIEAFKSLRTPQASFNQAKIYKKLAVKELESLPREEITSEMRSKHVILLTKARDCLNLTRERLRTDRQHPLHHNLSELMEEVESALSRIEPDPGNDHNIFGTSMSVDISVQPLGLTYQSSNLNCSEGEVTEPSVSSIRSPAGGGDMPHTPHSVQKLNGNTPRRLRYVTHDHRHHSNGELIDVGQLMQIQALHNELKKVHEEQKILSDKQKRMDEKLDMLIESMNEMRRDKLKPTTTTEDLYFFGDEEEYPEDVLSGQYHPAYVPSYPPAPQPAPTFYPRGVQGTSTVTYGAPPPTQQPPGVIPLIPMRMPLDPTLAGYQPPQNLAFYNQGNLAFTEPPQQIPDFLRQNIPKPVIPPQQPAAPVNVVITTSDTLPTGPPPVQPTLSVTIPPQHRLGTVPTSSNTPTVASNPISTPPHKFQIPMPASAIKPSLEKSPISVPEDLDSEDDNEVEHDPCPDFKPIVPLPNEVNVTTGEEDDDILFENRAKLFRFVDKEWKERGVGVVKILKNRSTNKVRLLMRRDQVHKICANHLLKAEMELTMLKNSDRALVWVANDFAEEVFCLEKFCMKFKTPEEAIKFKDVFNEAKTKFGQSPQKSKEDKIKDEEKSNEGKAVQKSEKITSSIKSNKEQKDADVAGKVNLGGFTFTSPPKLKEPINEKAKPSEETKSDPQPAPSPFATFTFTQKPTTTLFSTSSLFAGLNNTQNKHNLFENENKNGFENPTTTSSSDISRKPILKQPILSMGQFNSVTDTSNKNDTEKCEQPLISQSQPKTHFNFNLTTSTPKEMPKSILKDSPVNTTPVTQAKALPNTKHIVFKDTSPVSPSQQTPTLSALLNSPKAPVVDFAALSKINENKTPQFGAGNKSKGFEGAGTPVFGSNRSRNDSEGENAEEFVPSAEFKPVIPLPELVEVKTGEEGQEVLFNERAKLLRFDPNAKEWKERGTGLMKILKDCENGITRFLMRRDQVHKVCCNHRIIPSLELRPSSSNQKAWTWYAVDYSEGEMKNELFAIRFKTVELAKKFKETVDQVQKQLREESTSKRSCPDSAPLETSSSTPINITKIPSAQEGDTTALPKLSELYRPKAGSWECKACYTVNGAKDSVCVCCDTSREKPKSPGPPLVPTITQEKMASNKPSLAEMFKPKAGSWECAGCLVRNDADKKVCPACSTPKPGCEVEVSKPTGSFNFGINSNNDKSTSFIFGMKSEDTVKSSFSFGIKPSGALQGSDITATQKSIEMKEIENKLQESTGFTFGLPVTPVSKTSVPFSFAPKNEVVSSSADSTSSSNENKEGSPFKFGGLFGGVETSAKTSFIFGVSNLEGGNDAAFGGGKHEFTFSGVKPCKSPGLQNGGKSPKSPSTGHDSDSENEDVVEEEGDHIIFQPVVPLPDKVPLTTGEEDEEVLYSHRAKLYRFAQGEWKERGVGDIKILRHNVTHKIRLLMRREPILKLCLNHFLTADMTFSPKDDRSWLWSAQDYSDGQLTSEKFCVRFKTADIASEFKAAVDSAQGELEANRSIKGEAEEKSVKTPNESNDLEIVYEAKVSEELRQAALKLMLPPNFYNYLNAPPCPGCRGCEPLSEEDESSVTEKKSTSQILLSGSKAPSAAITTTTSISQPFVFSVKTTNSQTNHLTSADSSSTPSNPGFTFSLKTTTASSTSSQFGITTTSNTSLPSFTFTLSNTTTPTSGTSIFGNTGSEKLNSSGFGSSSLFQTQVSNKSLFGGTSTFTSTTSTPTTKPLLFGTMATSQPVTTLSFGGIQNSTPTSMFQTPSSDQSPKTTTVTSDQSPNVFQTPTKIENNSSSKSSPFFSNLVSPQAANSGTGFVTTPNQNPSIFGGSSQTTDGLFGNVIDKSSDNGPGFLFRNTISFSDIAATSKPAFGGGSESSKFTWSGAGSNVFGGYKPSPSTKEQKEDNESGEDSDGDNEEQDIQHDPVFEPIVPLPATIELRTGEEDEDKEFCYPAKFYRYDSEGKQWKERGLGEMKILRHRETGSFRLLLRRDQVHKVVCNQLITAELELQSLAGSDKAFCWASMNMAEEYAEPKLEKVAVRFKNSEIAQEFKAKVEECIAKVKARKERAVAESIEPAVIIEEVAGGDYSEGSVDYCEGDYLDGEDFEVMFDKRATLHVKENDQWMRIGQGELKFLFASTNNTGHIKFTKDNKEQLMISAGVSSDVQQLNDKEVMWFGEDYDKNDSDFGESSYKAEFCTPQAASEFLSAFNEVLELSKTGDSSYLESDAED